MWVVTGNCNRKSTTCDVSIADRQLFLPANNRLAESNLTLPPRATATHLSPGSEKKDVAKTLFSRLSSLACALLLIMHCARPGQQNPFLTALVVAAHLAAICNRLHMEHELMGIALRAVRSSLCCIV
jgi:hypothetical protein